MLLSSGHHRNRIIGAPTLENPDKEGQTSIYGNYFISSYHFPPLSSRQNSLQIHAINGLETFLCNKIKNTQLLLETLKIPQPSIYGKLLPYCPGFTYVVVTKYPDKEQFIRTTIPKSVYPKSQGRNWRQLGKSHPRTEEVYIQGCLVFNQVFLESRATNWRIVSLIFRLGLFTTIKASETDPLRKFHWQT